MHFQTVIKLTSTFLANGLNILEWITLGFIIKIRNYQIFDYHDLNKNELKKNTTYQKTKKLCFIFAIQS